MATVHSHSLLNWDSPEGQMPNLHYSANCHGNLSNYSQDTALFLFQNGGFSDFKDGGHHLL